MYKVKVFAFLIVLTGSSFAQDITQDAGIGQSMDFLAVAQANHSISAFLADVHSSGTARSTTVSVSSSRNPSPHAHAVTFTATISPQQGGGAKGTVTFYDGTNQIGSGQVSNNTVMLTVSSLSIGNHSITAVYSGDSNFTGSSSQPLSQVSETSITTYHYDNYRTGWNQQETVLTPANVGQTTFGQLQTVTLDDQVEAQPLVVPGVAITAGEYQGTHDVVYVVTNNNSIYAIDVHSGTVLLSPNFGTPVQPAGCHQGINVGINSTPVIDPSSNTLYVMIYTNDPTGPTYRLHALDLGSLTDKVTPQVVTASATLTDGTTYNFNANVQRQRPGLLLTNGSIYAAFGSFCDLHANKSRGWLLGWTAGSLAPFPSNQLNDHQATSPNNFFLSSIWMAGYGPATDDDGNVLFVTANSDPSGTTYDGVTNIQESVVKVSPTLTSVLDLFTPYDWPLLDQSDLEFGSGGVLVLPDQPGSTPHLAVAAGKDGNMYLMNEDNLGGYSPTTNNVLGTYTIGGCWCGPSYFVDPSDGAGRVVSSGGGTIRVWKVETSPQVGLTKVGFAGLPTYLSPAQGGVQDPGFFTSVSSNGNASPIIWAISRPATNNNGSPIYLYAFNPESGGGPGVSPMTQLVETPAGTWPNTFADLNQVPVVANGLVFVASYRQLQIFGLLPPTTTTLASSPNPSMVGQSVTLTATVSSSSGSPTGTVTFYRGTTNIGTATLSNGQAVFNKAFPDAGTHPMTAVYSGDSTLAGSTSSILSEVVNLATTTTTLASSLNPSFVGQSVTFTATVSSSSGSPTGTVTFYRGTTNIGTATLSNGQAVFSKAFPDAGTHPMTAVYSGDSTFAGSTSSVLSEVVNQATTTTTLVSSLNPAFVGQSVTFTATVSSSSGSPTGKVTFYRGTTNIGTATLTNGQAALNKAFPDAGTHPMTAAYSADSIFAGSTSSILNQVVNQATTTTALASSLNPSTVGQSVTFTATVSSSSGSPTGTVTFYRGTTNIGTATLSNGKAVFSKAFNDAGTHPMTAVYSADSIFAGSTSSVLNQVVNQAAATTTLVSSSAIASASRKSFFFDFR